MWYYHVPATGWLFSSSASRTSGSEPGDCRLDLRGAWPSLEGDPEVLVSVPSPFAHEDLAGGHSSRASEPSSLGHKNCARDGDLAGLKEATETVTGRLQPTSRSQRPS